MDPGRPPRPHRSTRPPEEQQVVTMVRWLLIAVIVVVAWHVLGTLAHVLAPVLAAFAIAYLLDPVLERLVARGMSRAAAAALLVGGFLLGVTTLLVVLTPLAVHEIQRFVHDLPEMIERVTRWLAENTGLELPEHPILPSPDGAEPGSAFAAYLRSDEFKQVVEQAIGPAQQLAGAALGGVLAFLAFLAEMLLVPVFAFYFLVDWPNITARIQKLVPPRRRATVMDLLRQVDGVVSGWVRGQATVTSILAVLYAIGFSIVGIHLAIPIGLLVGALTVIPFVGTLVGSVIVIGVTLLDWQGPQPLIGVVAVIGVLHLLEAAVLTPKIVGHKVGLSESAALFAVVAGGKLLGFVGVLLAVPLAATVAVLLRHAVRRYESSEFFGHEDDALVPVTDAMAVVMPHQDAPGTRRVDPAADPAPPAPAPDRAPPDEEP